MTRKINPNNRFNIQPLTLEPRWMHYLKSDPILDLGLKPDSQPGLIFGQGLDSHPDIDT